MKYLALHREATLSAPSAKTSLKVPSHDLHKLPSPHNLPTTSPPPTHHHTDLPSSFPQFPAGIVSTIMHRYKGKSESEAARKRKAKAAAAELGRYFDDAEDDVDHPGAGCVELQDMHKDAQ